MTSKIKVGDCVDTPRFCRVEISKVFKDEEHARRAGFNEPTHYERRNPCSAYGILGKSLDAHNMVFCAYVKQ